MAAGVALLGAELVWAPVRRLLGGENAGRGADDPSSPASTAPSGGLPTARNLGIEPDGTSKIYLVRGGTPEQNMGRLLEALGGIETLVGKEDIVVLKPNAQWWNQGMTNTNAMKAFIEAVLAIPGFEGEVVIADNHQYAAPNSRAWTTDERNGDFNYNELVEHFQNAGHPNVTKYHWRCAGPNPSPLEGDDALGSRIVKGPWEGDGYVWRDDIVYVSPLGRRCIMTYPIFTSAYSGVTIDFKDGAWEDGEYTGQPVKFINFSALNHHGPYCGVTASVKNYMGIVDMTCGFQGTEPKGFWNTHFVGLRSLDLPFERHLPWRIQHAANQYRWKHFHHTGAALGMFMREIQMADINFITADWVGYGSRTKGSLSTRPKALLASRDPVALDYVASVEVLMPVSKAAKAEPSLLRLNDAANEEGPFHAFLNSCQRAGIGNLDSALHWVLRSKG